ncbi:MAG: bifunctional riboflavin kinase/FAD synthetase [Campylobacterota bacterium]
MSSTFTGLKNIDTIAIGNFDGLHLGHRKLLENLGESGAVAVIEHGRACLTPGYFRKYYCSYPMFFYDLDKIKTLSAREFTALLQKDFPSLKRIVIGYDFVFGHRKSGDKKLLEKYFDVLEVPQFRLEGTPVHSKTIKKLLTRDLARANAMLGRSYVIEGRRVSGQGIGAKELVATINLQTNFCLPKEGVYCTKTQIQSRWYDSVSFVGHRKTTDNAFAVETHLLDQKIVVTSSYICVRFYSYLRQNLRFDNLGDLKSQIDKDITQCRSEHAKR